MSSTTEDALAAAGRGRNLRRGIVGSVVSRAAAVLAPLLLIPVTLDYLGSTLFGLWMTLTAASALTSFADLGLGNSLMTRLPAALAVQDLGQARRLVSSSYALLAGVAVLLTAALWASLPFGPWDGIFDPQGAADPKEVNVVAVMALTTFALNVPCSLVQRLYYAQQRAAAASLWQTTASIAPLIPVLTAIQFHVEPLVVIVIATATTPAVNMVNTIWFFAKVSPDLRPRAKDVFWRESVRILRLGSQFFVLTAILLLATNSDNFIIAQNLGLTAVALFSIPARVFLQLGTLVALVNVPLWSANADALSRDDRAWIRRVTRRMVGLSSLASLAVAIPMSLFGPQLIDLWTRQDLGLSVALTLGLGVWWCLMAALSPLFMVQNGAGVVVPQLVGWAAYAALSIPGKILVAPFGFTVIPWLGAALLLVTVVPAALVGYRRVMRQPARTPQVMSILETPHDPDSLV